MPRSRPPQGRPLPRDATSVEAVTRRAALLEQRMPALDQLARDASGASGGTRRRGGGRGKPEGEGGRHEHRDQEGGKSPEPGAHRALAPRTSAIKSPMPKAITSAPTSTSQSPNANPLASKTIPAAIVGGAGLASVRVRGGAARGGRRPFECLPLPRIVAGGPAVAQRDDEVDDEHQDPGGDYECPDRGQHVVGLKAGVRRVIRHPSRHPV